MISLNWRTRDAEYLIMETEEHDHIGLKGGSLGQNVISFLGSSLLLSQGRKGKEPGKEIRSRRSFRR